MKVITAEELKALLEYDPSTGSFKWIKTGKGRRLDRIAGSPDRHGYLQTRILGKIYFNHRLAWLYEHGKFPCGVIDHIDGNPLNNAIDNLRDVDRRTNQENQRRAPVSNKSTGLLGAFLHRGTGRYYSHIQMNKKSVYLGLFDTPEDAHQAYLKAKRIFHFGATI